MRRGVVTVRYKLVRQTLTAEAMRKTARAQIETLRIALTQYRVDTGTFPSTAHGLWSLAYGTEDMPPGIQWNGPYVKPPLPSDPWCNPYQYRFLRRANRVSYDLWSAGPDGKSETDDDIGVSESGNGRADSGKKALPEVAENGSKTPEDLAMAVVESLKKGDLASLVKETVFSDDDAKVMIDRIRKAFSKDGQPLAADDYPPPFFRGRWSSGAEDILEDWQRFVERGKRDYDIEWETVKLERIECKIRETRGVVGASGITILLSAGDDLYKMFIDDCYLTDRGWLAADGPSWKGKVTDRPKPRMPGDANAGEDEEGSGKSESVRPGTLGGRPSTVADADDIQFATGVLFGRVVNAEGAPVKDAYVVVCDQATGAPIAGKALRPITEEALAGRLKTLDILKCSVDLQGRFRFENVPAGQYRLIAQFCGGTRPEDSFDKAMAREIQPCGIAEDVVVSKELPPDVTIRPLGTGVLRIEDNLKGENGVLVAISTMPTRADPALGFVGWGGDFALNLIGGTRKMAGPLTVSGLPEGKIHIAACGFLADDMSGWGASEVVIKAGQTTNLHVPINSTWAGHHEPPERLRPLFRKIHSSGPQQFIEQVFRRNRIEIPLGISSIQDMWRRDWEISRHLDREVELPTGETAAFGDVMTVMQYIRTAKLRKE